MSVCSVTEHIFNDDLLANPGDMQWVEQRYSKLLPVLDFPELRQAFLTHDALAIQAHRRVMGWGLLAILCAVIALLAAASEPLWGGQGLLPRAVGTGAELLGLLGAFVGAGGMWLGPSKRDWLLNRLAAEQLRQWHFQFILQRGDLIVPALGGDESQVHDFRAARACLFEDFRAGLRGKLDSLLTSLLSVNYEKEKTLVPRGSLPHHGYTDQDELFVPLAEIYWRLRLRHQLQYVQYKLQTSTEYGWRQFLRWPILIQKEVLGGLGTSCIVMAILVSIAIIIGHVLPMVVGETPVSAALEHPLLNSAAVGLAIVAVAVRTIEDGLGLKPDIERYRHFANELERLLTQWQEAPGLSSRLSVMERCEEACFEELREFLVVHHHTKFAL